MYSLRQYVAVGSRNISYMYDDPESRQAGNSWVTPIQEF